MVYELIGWYGAIALLGAYMLVSFGVVYSDTWLYQILNATGALGIAIASWKKRAYQPAVLNVIWTLVAVFTLISILYY